MTKNNQEKLDLLGVGIGPFNLSLAALLSPLKSIKSCFFDQNESFVWHPGMLLPGAEIQVSYLKDLVTLVDPTNPYSFIAYLAKHKRLYRFMNAQFKNVLRLEFSQYLNWVSHSLPNLFFNERVEEVRFAESGFLTHTTQRKIASRHLVLGNGLTANVPACAKNHLGPKVFHNKDFLNHVANWQDKRIVVIGGGQSGAEIVNYLLSNAVQLPNRLTWVTRRSHFVPLDDSTFTNDLFTPDYNEYFYQLPDEKKTHLLREQRLASDGISLGLLESIYQKLYHLEFLQKKGKFFKTITRHQLMHIQPQENQYALTLEELNSLHKQEIHADIIILCTGYHWEYPPYLAPLSDKIPLLDGQFCVNQDFSIAWDGPNENRIYVQNAARHAHGIAEPNLCLMAWRSAKIINSFMEKEIYDLVNDDYVQNLEVKYAANA